MKYLEWNNIIASHFFDSTKAGCEVLLYITQEEVTKLGKENFSFSSDEESWKDYCRAVKVGLRGNGMSRSFSENVRYSIEEWSKYCKWIFELKNQHPFEIDGVYVTNKATSITYPIFIGFIPILIIPLTESKIGIRANSYYDPLNDFLHVNNISSKKEGTSTFAQIDPLWRQLDKWSKEYFKTDLGLFTERQFGNPNWKYVGKIFSQCLLTPKNIRDISKVFWEADIAPHSFISDKRLEAILLNYGGKCAGFSNKLMEIVREDNHPLKKIVLDIVRSHFESWEGEVIQYQEDGYLMKPKSGWIYSVLLSSFELDFSNEELNHSYYLYSKNDFPEDLTLNDQFVTYLSNGFSSAIKVPFDQKIEWRDTDNKWRTTPTKNDIILYSSGMNFGLSADTYIETETMSRLAKMYLMCSSRKRESIEEWGLHFEPNNFKRLDYDNIPNGFLLYRFNNPIIEHSTEDVLKFSPDKKIVFRGGLKISNRDFLNYFLPNIAIVGADGSERIFLEYTESKDKVYLTRSVLVLDEFMLPSEMALDSFFTIGSDNEDLIGSNIPYRIVESKFNPNDIIESDLVKRNNRGEVCTSNVPSYVRGSNTVYDNWQRQAICLPYFFPSDYEMTFFNNEREDYLLSNGNLVLEYLTQMKSICFEKFSYVIDLIANRSEVWKNDKGSSNPKYIKQQSINYYDYLGFLDYDYSLDRITINKPQIILIPSSKSVEAILIGGRIKKTIEQLSSICVDEKIRLQIIPQQEQLNSYLLPDTIKLIPADCKNSSQAWMKLRRIAEKLHIQFNEIQRPYCQPQIVQFGLQDFSNTLIDYKNYLLNNAQGLDGDIEWARKTFNIDELKFKKDSDLKIDKELSFHEYYFNYKFKYIIWIGGRSYQVDRSWGKFLLLAEIGKNVIFYSKEKEILAIPITIQLPRLIAESIMLLSGQAPYLKRIEVNNKMHIYQLYQNVPKLFAENLFKKFNQQLQIHNSL